MLFNISWLSYLNSLYIKDFVLVLLSKSVASLRPAFGWINSNDYRTECNNRNRSYIPWQYRAWCCIWTSSLAWTVRSPICPVNCLSDSILSKRSSRVGLCRLHRTALSGRGEDLSSAKHIDFVFIEVPSSFYECRVQCLLSSDCHLTVYHTLKTSCEIKL